jgi:uncharacterized protein YmfQ (DUF2313 family)
MDYLQLLKSLLPRGRAWGARSGSTMAKFLQVFANELERLHNRVLDALDEAFVNTMSETVDDWENEYGITPGYSDTLEDRRAAISIKKNNEGGQSITRFLAICKEVTGYSSSDPGVTPHVRITEHDYPRFRVGISHVGDKLYGNDTGYSKWTWFIRGTDVETLLAGIFTYDLIPANTEVFLVNE